MYNRFLTYLHLSEHLIFKMLWTCTLCENRGWLNLAWNLVKLPKKTKWNACARSCTWVYCLQGNYPNLGLSYILNGVGNSNYWCQNCCLVFCLWNCKSFVWLFRREEKVSSGETREREKKLHPGVGNTSILEGIQITSNSLLPLTAPLNYKSNTKFWEFPLILLANQTKP